VAWASDQPWIWSVGHEKRTGCKVDDQPGSSVCYPGSIGGKKAPLMRGSLLEDGEW
jgi:hypothetical protein